MKYFLLFLISFLTMPITVFSQMKVGKLDLENEQQIHVLTLKDGMRYVGRIAAMNGRKIVFQLAGVEREEELIIRRKDVNIIGSFTPSSDNGGVLRSPFDWIHQDFPNIELDTKLDIKNHSQQVKLVVDGKAFFGRIKQVRKGGVSVQINGQVEFFRFVNLSEITVIGWSYLDVEKIETPQAMTFQVDTFPKERLYDKFEPDFKVGDATQKHVIYTQVGNRFNGRIMEIDAGEIRLKMENGTLVVFEEAEIKKVEVYKLGHTRKNKSDGVVYKRWKLFEDDDYILGQSRLFVSQTGFTVKKGEIEYRGTQILINEMNFGITDNISVGAGLFPLIVENIFTFKVDVSKDIGDFVHLSAGGQAFVNIGGIDSYGEGEGAVLGYAAASFGSSAYFLNVAYNRWMGLEGFSEGDVVSVGGSFKIGRQFRIFGDFFFLYDEQNNDDFFFNDPTLETYPALIFGASWFHKFDKIDFGVFFVPDTGVQDGDEAVFLPTFGYVKRF